LVIVSVPKFLVVEVSVVMFFWGGGCYKLFCTVCGVDSWHLPVAAALQVKGAWYLPTLACRYKRLPIEKLGRPMASK
jgi:hypothetical protein